MRISTQVFDSKPRPRIAMHSRNRISAINQTPDARRQFRKASGGHGVYAAK